MLVLNILIFFIFSAIAYQDFRQKEVSWYLFPLAFTVLVAKALLQIEVYEWIRYFGFNLLFITIQIFILFLFFATKNKKFVNIINLYIGIGDLLFFLLICAAFSPLLFGLYFVGSLILLTIIYGIIKISKDKKQKEIIPLAGGLSVSYILIFISGFIYTGFNAYNDLLIGDLLFGR